MLATLSGMIYDNYGRQVSDGAPLRGFSVVGVAAASLPVMPFRR